MANRRGQQNKRRQGCHSHASHHQVFLRFGAQQYSAVIMGEQTAHLSKKGRPEAALLDPLD
jgi:hypothetical protein